MPDPGRIPGPIVIPNCVQMRLSWTAPNGKVVHNVLHGRVGGGFAVTSTVAENIFSDIKGDGRTTTFLGKISSQCALLGVDLRDLRSVDQPLADSTSAAAPGTVSADPLPSEVAFVVTLRTALAGRSNRGRVYLLGFEKGMSSTAGHADALLPPAAVGFVQAVSDAMNGSGVTLCIANPARAAYTGSTGASHPARAASTVDVTTITARDNIFDSQRRRSQ